MNLTNKEKNEIKKHGEFLYQQINQKRLNIKKEDKFYKKYIQFRSTILEDVPRTGIFVNFRILIKFHFQIFNFFFLN